MRIVQSAFASLALALAAVPTAAQESAAPFDAPLVIATGFDRITDLLDLDADGSADAVGWFDHRVSGWHNDGAGAFTRRFTIDVPNETGYSIRQLRVGRLDGDELDDFAFCFERRIVAYSSNGDAEPTLLFDHLGVANVIDFALADFDGDGLDDVVAILKSRFDSFHRLKLYRNAGDGRLVLHDEREMQFFFGPERLFVAEMNGDGLPDFGFFADPGLILFRLGGRGLPEPLVLPHDMAFAMPAAGDVDGDGDEDVVLFGASLPFRVPGYQVLRRTGPDAFVAEAPAPGGVATRLADVDGDGDLDGVCCGGDGGSTPFNDAPSLFQIALNDGSGAFAPTTPMAGLGSYRIAGAADVDHDGDVDLVAGRCVYYARGPLRGFDREPIPFAGPVPPALVDADSDGDLDVGFSLAETCANLGDGSFAERVPALLDPPAGLTLVGPGVAGDFDGDGDADLLVEARDGAGAFVEMRLLCNCGCGAFADGGSAAPPGKRVVDMADLVLDPSLAVAVDADGDGDLDVIAQDRIDAPYRTRVWRNDGTGAFALAQILLDEALKGVADMNGDGLVDLVVVPLDRYPAWLRLGRGAAGFDAISTRLVGLNTPWAFALADFDDDGDVDVAGVGLETPRRFTIAANNGALGFRPTPAFGFAWAPREPTRDPLVVPVDANGDGRTDAIVRYLVGDGNPMSGVFLRAEQGLVYDRVAEQMMWAARAADVDGDGDADLIQAACDGRSTTPIARGADRVIRNARIAPPAAGVRRQFGEGTPGTAGIAPILGVTGELRPGVRPDYRLSGGLGGATAILLIGTERRSDAVRGGTLLVDPRWRRKLRLDGDGAAAGTGSFSFVSKPIAPRHAGLTLHYQVVIRDPSATAGWAFSNGLSITFGSGE